MSGTPTVRVVVASRPDNVALIREVLAGLAEEVDLDGILEDVKAAVSEACNNVVVHAYDGEEGPLEVDIRVVDDALSVVVRDQGVGLHGKSGSDGEAHDGLGRGLGMPVMESLADHLATRSVFPHGTEVELRFSLPPSGDGRSAAQPTSLGALIAAGDTVRVAIAPAASGGGVLARLMSAAAARADFSLDRFSDAQLLADALSANLTSALSGAEISFGIAVAPRALTVELGPLKPGGSRGALDDSSIGGIGSIIERLTDEVLVRPSPSGEVLGLVIRDERPSRRRA